MSWLFLRQNYDIHVTMDSVVAREDGHEEQKGKDGREGESALQDLRGLQPAL